MKQAKSRGGDYVRLARKDRQHFTAGVLSGTASLVARKAGFRELGDLAELGLHYPMAPVGTTRSFLEKNETVAREFMLAYIEAIHDFKRNQEAAAQEIQPQRRPRGSGRQLR